MGLSHKAGQRFNWCPNFACPDKPGTPGVPEASKVGKTYVDLRWDKPRSDGGSKITGTLSCSCIYVWYLIFCPGIYVWYLIFVPAFMYGISYLYWYLCMLSHIHTSIDVSYLIFVLVFIYGISYLY